jgi:formamidopyrimidine-DNA glycosylase
MPEGAELYTSSLVLNEELQNFYLLAVDYTKDFKNSRDLLNQTAVKKDLPLHVKEIFSRGKRVNFVCENMKKEGSVFVWFYSMTGRLCFEHRGKPLIILTFNKNLPFLNNDPKNKNPKYDEDDDIILYYEDSRTLGFVKYATTEEEIDDIYKDVGPDFMYDEVSLEYFTQVIQNPRIKKKQIGILLIENDKFSGIGNYLRAEILYASKISPYRILEELTQKDIKIIHKNIIKIMKESAEKGGMSFRDYLNPHGKMGNFKCKVYGQEYDPLGNKVLSEKIGSPPKGKDNRRTIHWVPEVQK